MVGTRLVGGGGGKGTANNGLCNVLNRFGHTRESSPGELNKIQNSIGGDSVHIIQCQLLSVVVRWTSVGLLLNFLLLSGGL